MYPLLVFPRLKFRSYPHLARPPAAPSPSPPPRPLDIPRNRNRRLCLFRRRSSLSPRVPSRELALPSFPRPGKERHTTLDLPFRRGSILRRYPPDFRCHH